MTISVMLYLYILVLSISVSDEASIANIRKAGNYLRTFGYFSGPCIGYICRLKETSALKKFQQFANLQQTGRYDIQTIRKIDRARCGNSDVEKIRKDQITWAKRNTRQITWRYDKTRERYDISSDSVIQILRKAFSFWSSKANIDFKEDYVNEPDIWIYFAKYEHGDKFGFDGTDIVFAHAFYPTTNDGIAGDIHFDWSEKFTLGFSGINGRNLLWVATHEIGHSLGLTHSSNAESIMNPWYPGDRRHVILHNEDIRRIQDIYGKRATHCLPTGITAAWYISEPGFYGVATATNEMYLFDRNRLLVSGPHSLRQNLRKSRFRQPIDAACTIRSRLADEDQIIFFSGNQYSIYKGNVKFGYVSGPHSIHDADSPLKVSFPRFVKKIDAAVSWKRNGKIYFFFKGVYGAGYYYRYDPIKKKFEDGYKFTIKGWGALGWQGPDAAFSISDKERTVFIKGNKAYKYNDRLAILMPGYPKRISSSDIFQCKT